MALVVEHLPHKCQALGTKKKPFSLKIFNNPILVICIATYL
jgi:hypothetical protein